MEIRDLTVLDHLKLRTEDGEITDGPQVTKELIDELKTQGRNPTWFARAAWVKKTYGPRTEPELEPARDEADVADQPTPTKESPGGADAEIVSILKEQLRQSQESHQEDKRAFREQIAMLKEMFDTLKADHSDTKELLKEVHKVFGNVSQAYLAGSRGTPGTPDAPLSSTSEPAGARPVIEVTPDIEAEKGTAPSKPTEPAPTPPSSKRSHAAPKQQTGNARRKKPAPTPQPGTEQPRKPKWYERLLSRSRK